MCLPVALQLQVFAEGSKLTQRILTTLSTGQQTSLHCKQVSPDSSSACNLAAGCLLPVLQFLLLSMSCLKSFTKGDALSELSTCTGSMVTSLSLDFPVYTLTYAPSAVTWAWTVHA